MKLGFPLVEREKVIRDLLRGQPESTFPMEIFNTVHQLPVIEVSIDLPKYRLQNGRTASLQLQDVATNGLDRNFYRSDPEADECQSRQHELLRQLVVDEKSGAMRNAFEKEKRRQLDPILVDRRGFIVNGNRRVCYWRELIKSAAAEFAHFEVIRVASLPETITEQEIRKIESRLQLQPDLRAEYTWHAQANMYRVLMQELNLDSAGVAENFDLSKGDVDTSLRMIELAESYLESRGNSQKWSLLDKKEFGFRRLASEEKRVESFIDREILQHSAFIIIDDLQDFGDRAWSLIPKIRSSIEDWKKTVNEKHGSSFSAREIGNVENPFVMGASGITDLNGRIALYLRSANRPQREALGESLGEFLEDVADRESEISRGMRLIRGLRVGLGNVKNAAEHGLVPEANTEGVAEIVVELRGLLENVERWLRSRHN